jgi:hypothetical protein
MTARSWTTNPGPPPGLADIQAAAAEAARHVQAAQQALADQVATASRAVSEAFSVTAGLAAPLHEQTTLLRSQAQQLVTASEQWVAQNTLRAEQLAHLAAVSELLRTAGAVAHNPRRLRSVLRRIRQRRDNLHAGLDAVADSLTELLHAGEVLLAVHRQQTRCRRHQHTPTKRCALLALNLAPNGPPVAVVLTGIPAHGPP